jgi:hypothetical protein
MLPSMRSEFLSFISDERFTYIVDTVDRMPVLDEEIDVDLANELLEIGDIDPGEAALFSGMLSMDAAELLTGDKRALSAFAVSADDSYVDRLKGRCLCVESLLLDLVEQFEFDVIVECLREAVEVDVAVRVCLGSTCSASKEEFCLGLRSYAQNFEGKDLLKPSKRPSK